MPSTLTAGGKDGKQCEKIGRSSAFTVFVAILSRLGGFGAWMIALMNGRPQFGIGGVAAGLFAGKPAPTVIVVEHKSCVHPDPLWERACPRRGQ